MDVRFPSKDVEVAIHSACMANGVTSLKGKKAEDIASFVEGGHVLICLPTGYGKSLCFALLPLVFDHLRGKKGSIVICVSPLHYNSQLIIIHDFITGCDNKRSHIGKFLAF